jgi:hypothetical protein
MVNMNVTDTKYLKDMFKIGYEAFESSRDEAKLVWDLYHNRHYTSDQLNVLEQRGQPKETFNVIKLFARMLLGYYSTVINNIQINPVGIEDVPTASVMNDLVHHILRDNNFDAEGEKIKLNAIVTGMMGVYVDVVSTGNKDEFGREHKKVVLEYVPESEIVLDPMSRRDDYEDARFQHRFKWITEQQIEQLFGKAKREKLTEYYDFTGQNDTAYDVKGKDREQGEYKQYDNYLVIHSVVKDTKGDTWSVFWHDNVILDKKKITNKEVKWPYRTIRIHSSESSDAPEYYGIFREVLESQKAINQALIKLQLMVNSQKAFVQEGAVDNLADFTNAFNRVTAVIPVRQLSGIKIENLSRDVLDQYTVIDKAFDRIQRMLGINDSFLGMAFASDSGRKVKLQQNASIMSLRYLTGRIEVFYRLLGWDIANLVKQYYTSHQVVRIADDFNGQRWIELNKPMQVWSGQMDANNQPVMRTEYEEVLDPASGEPMVDENGNYVIAPIPEQGTELAYTNFDIEIYSNAFNDEDEKSQLLLEQVMAGAVGQMLAQVNPAGFFKAASLSLKTTKTKHSPDIAAILDQTAMMLGGDQQAAQQAQGMAQQMPGQLAQQSGPQNGASSRTLNLPQNTNEGGM